MRYIRCTVTSWDDGTILATTGDGAIRIMPPDHSLDGLLTTGTQLNLLNSRMEDGMVRPTLIVVEPDYLVDISAIAACFQDYGHHPYSYLLNRLKPRANSQPILLGNYASTVLDDVIHQPSSISPLTSHLPPPTSNLITDTLRKSFRQQVLQFCTCENFNPQQFKADAVRQVANIREAVDKLFSDDGYDRSKALLEPSFICEQLGLQGRVDLMTTDMRLLVEQKSGKKWFHEAHYVQLLLYYGVLQHNFNLPYDQVDMRLLYSKYPASEGLQKVHFYHQLFHEAITLRNRIVAMETTIARDGFAPLLSQLNADKLLENPDHAEFFERYVQPRMESIIQPMKQLNDAERDYVDRMVTFVYREQVMQKLHPQEQSIITGILQKVDGDDIVIADITLPSLPDAHDFRRGDMVTLYHYDDQPDPCAAILFKGTIRQLTDTTVTVQLNDAQGSEVEGQRAEVKRQRSKVFTSEGHYAIEHAHSDIGTTSALRSIHAFCTAKPDRRQLLLGQRKPRRDATLQLSRSYHPHYDDVLLRAKQARDYFLLQGPPGTGKTSMALRFLVEEELSSSIINSQFSIVNCQFSILLTAYTNRAVDEICEMLEGAGQQYIRLGNDTSCDPRFASHLLSNIDGTLDDMRQLLLSTPVIVGTTSTLLARPHILQLKHFSLCIVDEASQILEPNIIGLLVSESIDRFILVGDHKQLPAVIQQPDDEPRLHQCRLSLFERLLSVERAAGRTEFVGLLQHQGRMHPDIAAFPNEMFYATQQLQPVPLPHQTEQHLNYTQPSEDALDDILKQRRVLFIDSSLLTLKSSLLTPQARLVADLLRRIYRQTADHFDPDHTVGVIVPYRSRIALIRKELVPLGIPQLLDISIDTVERYQGSQRDVIIYDFTAEDMSQLEFLTANCFVEDGRTIDRKLNVAMTRARQQLIMIGNPDILCQNPLFDKLIGKLKIRN
jgi:hypothetical protein